LRKDIKNLCKKGLVIMNYIAYASNGIKLEFASMAEAINTLEKGGYQAANIFRLRSDGIQELVYEYRRR